MKSIKQWKNQLLNLRLVAPLLLVLCLCGNALAAGTESFTLIQNSADIDYQVGGVDQATASSNIAEFRVDRRVDLTMTAPQTFAAATPNTQIVWPLVLTNEGNGDQGYRINFQADGGNTFQATNVYVYIDGGSTPFDLDATDTLYSTLDGGTLNETFAGVLNIGDLGNDGTMNLLVVADIPIGAANAQTATYHLIATTVNDGSPGASPADDTVATPDTDAWDAMTEQTVFGDGQGTVDAAAPDGMYSTSVTYTISSASLTITKSAAVTDDGMGSSNPKAIPGATVQYRIQIVNGGAQPAEAVTIQDAVPADTTFVAGTVTADIGGSSITPTVTYSDPDLEVVIGDIPNGQTANVYFDVTIN